MGLDLGDLIKGDLGEIFSPPESFIFTIGGTIAGATIGFAIGGPMGILPGAQAGYAIGAAIDQQKKIKNQIKDLSPTYSFKGWANQIARGAPLQFIFGRIKTAGALFYSSEPGKTMNIAIGLGFGELEAIEDIRLNDISIAELPDCSASVYTGTTTQTLDSRLSYNPSTDTGIKSALKRFAYIALTLTASEKLSGGIPTVTTIVKGLKIPVWNGIDWNTVAEYSTNPAAIIRYILTSKYLLGIPFEFIDDEAFGNAFDYYNELVDSGRKDAQGQIIYEKRYEFSYILDVQRRAEDILNELKLACLSELIFSNNKYILKPIKKVDLQSLNPFHFNNANIVKNSFQWSNIPRSEKYQRINISYFDEEIWEFKNCPIDSANIDTTKTVKTIDIALPSITKYSTAFRIGAKLMNENNFCDEYCSFIGDIDSVAVEIGDIVKVTFKFSEESENYVYQDRFFRVVGIIENPENFTREYQCREYNETVYDDITGNEQLIRANDFPNPSKPPLPIENLQIEEFQDVMKDGTWIPKIVGTFAQSNDIFFHHADIEMRIGDTGEWKKVAESFGVFEIKNLEAEKKHYIRAQAVNILGIKSDYVVSAPEYIEIKGRQTPPQNITGFSGTINPNREIELKWDAVLDKYNDAGYYEIRDGNDWDTIPPIPPTTVIATELRGTTYKFLATKRIYRLMLKAFSTVAQIWSEQEAVLQLDRPAPLISGIEVFSSPPLNIGVKIPNPPPATPATRLDIHIFTQQGFMPSTATLVKSGKPAIDGNNIFYIQPNEPEGTTIYIKACAVDDLSSIVGDEFTYPAQEKEISLKKINIPDFMQPIQDKLLSINTIIPNGSFETNSLEDGKTPDGWTMSTTGNGDYFLEETEPVPEGEKYLKLTNSGSGGATAETNGLLIGSAHIGNANERVSLAVETIAFVTWASVNPAPNAQVVIRYFDSDNQHIHLGIGNGITSDGDAILIETEPNDGYYPLEPHLFICGLRFKPINAKYFKIKLIGGASDNTIAGSIYFDYVTVNPIKLNQIGGFHLDFTIDPPITRSSDNDGQWQLMETIDIFPVNILHIPVNYYFEIEYSISHGAGVRFRINGIDFEFFEEVNPDFPNMTVTPIGFSNLKFSKIKSQIELWLYDGTISIQKTSPDAFIEITSESTSGITRGGGGDGSNDVKYDDTLLIKSFNILNSSLEAFDNVNGKPITFEKYNIQPGEGSYDTTGKIAGKASWKIETKGISGGGELTSDFIRIENSNILQTTSEILQYFGFSYLCSVDNIIVQAEIIYYSYDGTQLTTVQVFNSNSNNPSGVSSSVIYCGLKNRPANARFCKIKLRALSNGAQIGTVYFDNIQWRPPIPAIRADFIFDTKTTSTSVFPNFIWFSASPPANINIPILHIPVYLEFFANLQGKKNNLLYQKFKIGAQESNISTAMTSVNNKNISTKFILPFTAATIINEIQMGLATENNNDNVNGFKGDSFAVIRI